MVMTTTTTTMTMTTQLAKYLYRHFNCSCKKCWRLTSKGRSIDILLPFDLQPQVFASSFSSLGGASFASFIELCAYVCWALEIIYKETRLSCPENRLVMNYSESELCGGAVTVSFSKYLAWQAMHFLQRSTHFSKTCCRLLITSKFLVSELLFVVGKGHKSHGARSGLYSRCSDGVPLIHFFQAEHRIQFGSRPHAISGLFQSWKGSSEVRNFEVINGLQHVFEKWVERCKKCIACQGRGTSKERPSQHIHKVPTRSNKMSPRTLQTALVPVNVTASLCYNNKYLPDGSQRN
jgi:hypothetical protein